MEYVDQKLAMLCAERAQEIAGSPAGHQALERLRAGREVPEELLDVLRSEEHYDHHPNDRTAANWAATAARWAAVAPRWRGRDESDNEPLRHARHAARWAACEAARGARNEGAGQRLSRPEWEEMMRQSISARRAEVAAQQRDARSLGRPFNNENWLDDLEDEQLGWQLLPGKGRYAAA